MQKGNYGYCNKDGLFVEYCGVIGKISNNWILYKIDGKQHMANNFESFKKEVEKYGKSRR